MRDKETSYKIKMYLQGTYNHTILKDLLGNGIFTVDGDKWREQRKVKSHNFSTKALREVNTLIFRENAVELAHTLSEAATNNQILDMSVSQLDTLDTYDLLYMSNPKMCDI